MQLQKGLTLVELMVVMAIVVVITGVAVVTYQRYMHSSAQDQVLQEFLSLVSLQEKSP